MKVPTQFYDPQNMLATFILSQKEASGRKNATVKFQKARILVLPILESTTFVVISVVFAKFPKG